MSDENSQKISIKIVSADYYLAKPIAELKDPCYSGFKSTSIYNVPIIRIFGPTSDGNYSNNFTLIWFDNIWTYLYPQVWKLVRISTVYFLIYSFQIGTMKSMKKICINSPRIWIKLSTLPLPIVRQKVPMCIVFPKFLEGKYGSLFKLFINQDTVTLLLFQTVLWLLSRGKTIFENRILQSGYHETSIRFTSSMEFTI